MRKLGEPRRYVTDHVDVKRTAFLVEEADVGKVQKQYLGQYSYTFEAKDVGRLVEVIQNYSPGYLSWGFGSIFSDLDAQYPDPYPYIKEAS